MRWSIKIGALAGIGVYMHATFPILIAWVGWTHWKHDQSLGTVVNGILFILALFGCVVLHELGHALAARRYGIATRDITLLPIGGVARLERMPEDPKQEFVVALAGPVVNIVIAVVLGGWLVVTGGLVPVTQLGVTAGPFLERLMFVNIFLVVFNLLPAFPMDGGRILRAMLATRLEYTRATKIAVSIGQAMALLFAWVGLMSNPFLVLIALFVWMGASQEFSTVRLRSSIEGAPVASAMLTDFHTLAPEDPLGRAVALTLAGSQREFPVVSGDQLVGLLTQAELLAGLSSQGPEALVGSAMQRDVARADSHEMLAATLPRLQAQAGHVLPVLHGGELVGLLTMGNVGEFVSFQGAARGITANRQRRGEAASA